MNIFDVLSLVCGLALFLYGMDVMGEALKKSAGGKLKTILGNLTSNKFKGFLLGLGVTAIIQSSSATTVMVVGFVNSGIMSLAQAVGVILGANVGTAVTAWITALNGIEGGADATAWLNYLKPDAWMPILALIGICCNMFAKKDKYKDIGHILLGFAVLMVGMDVMSGAVNGLKESESFHQILTLFDNPFLGILAGTVLTAIVQSSSASVGILQALSSTGAITYGAAMPIIMGQNIGTCVTAMISSVSANKNGKRAALVHLYFNIVGVALWMGCYYLVGSILEAATSFSLFDTANNTIIDMWGIAGVHTVFKIFSVILLFPFTKYLEKLAIATAKGSDEKTDEYADMLDDRLLETPAVALEQCHKITVEMAEISVAALKDAITSLTDYSPELAASIREIEDRTDHYEDILGTYLVKLSSLRINESDSNESAKLLKLINDFERISDHSVNILESAEEIREKDIKFTSSAMEELRVIGSAVNEILDLSLKAFVEDNLDAAADVEPLEQVIDGLKTALRDHHIARLQQGECSIVAGFVWSDLLTNLERTSDHCSNIAVCMVDMAQHNMNIHESLREVRSESADYSRKFKNYAEKYALAKNK